ncbi:MAG: DUF4184 family protein [Clostridia bacterium]
MPFTFAHPAAVVPIQALLRRYVIMTGLVVGSMSPDFEYFIHFKPVSVWGHTLIGFFVYNFPLVLLVSWLFHSFVKAPLIAHLPAPLDRWYAPLASQAWRIGSLRAFGLFFLSSIVGMLTHVGWDHFTHVNGYYVVHSAFLRETVPIFRWNVPVYKLAQHGSTLIGFLVIAVYLYRQRAARPQATLFSSSRTTTGKLRYWGKIVLVACLILLGKWVLFPTAASPFALLGELVVSALSSLILAVLIISIIYHTKERYT